MANTAPGVWKKTDAAPAIIADGVHLGRKHNSNGNGAGFVDSSETPFPGAGIAAIVEQEGETRYYAIGADFKGEPDDWTVRGAMVEVTPAAPAERPILPGVRLELPNGE